MAGRRYLEASSLAALLIACSISVAGADGQAPLPLEPDSLLAATAFGESPLLAEYSPLGSLLGVVELVDPSGMIDAPSGLTRIGDEYWIGSGSSIHQLDPATGEVTGGFSVAGGPTLTAVTNDGEFLLVGEFTANALNRFDTSGNFIDSIVLDTPNLFVAGADSDGLLIYVASHVTGDIHVFDMTGTTVGVIQTNLPSDMTAVALDSDGETFWVATGVGVNDVHRFDFDGNLVTTFPGQLAGIMGLVTLHGAIFGDGFESGDTSAWSIATQ